MQCDDDFQLHVLVADLVETINIYKIANKNFLELSDFLLVTPICCTLQCITNNNYFLPLKQKQ